MPRLRTEDPSLNSRALTWTVSAAAGTALASFAGLIGRWSANPALGWCAALAAAGLGRAAATGAGAADEDVARAWAVVGALAALAVPALLRVTGLSLAEPSLLPDPLGGTAQAAFVLGQAALLAAFAAGAGRAPRGAPARAARRRRFSPAPRPRRSLSASPSRRSSSRPRRSPSSPPPFVSSGLGRGAESAPLRARAFAGAAVLGVALAPFAPRLLRDVWMARLHAAYPGGGYLALADDGDRLWAAYRFSNGTAVMLRDGVPQTSDPTTTRLALFVLLGQRNGGTELLMVRPPEALIALAAQEDGALVTIADGSPAETAALDALGGGPSGARGLTRARRRRAAPNAALVFLPSPPGSSLGRLAGERPEGPEARASPTGPPSASCCRAASRRAKSTRSRAPPPPSSGARASRTCPRASSCSPRARDRDRTRPARRAAHGQPAPADRRPRQRARRRSMARRSVGEVI